MAKIPYKEGTWFAIPLRQGGYAPGVVARHIPRQGKIILAFIFGPKREKLPELEELLGLTPDSAIQVVRVGDLGLLKGDWPIIGNAPNWHREIWRIPVFIRKDDIGKNAWLVEYADDDPSQVVAEQRIPYESEGYERNMLIGSGVLEIVVSRILS